MKAKSKKVVPYNVSKLATGITRCFVILLCFHGAMALKKKRKRVNILKLLKWQKNNGGKSQASDESVTESDLSFSWKSDDYSLTCNLEHNEDAYIAYIKKNSSFLKASFEEITQDYINNVFELLSELNDTTAIPSLNFFSSLPSSPSSFPSTIFPNESPKPETPRPSLSSSPFSFPSNNPSQTTKPSLNPLSSPSSTPSSFPSAISFDNPSKVNTDNQNTIIQRFFENFGLEFDRNQHSCNYVGIVCNEEKKVIRIRHGTSPNLLYHFLGLDE